MRIVGRVVARFGDAVRFLRTYGQHLPLALRAIFSLSCTVRKLAGTFSGSDERIAVLYVGRGRNYSYLRRAVLPGWDVVEEVRTSLFTYRKPVDRMWKDCDVIIGDLSWPYDGLLARDGPYLDVPDWVDMFIELPKTWEAVIQSFRSTARKNDLRLIRRNRYEAAFTRERKALEDFYDHFYLPFVTHRHAADAVVASRRHVVRRGMTGQLVRVMRGSEVVAAGVAYPEGEVLFFLWTGLPAAFVESPPEAAISALYLFIVRYAFDEGYRFVDFGGTRGFLNDGILQFKRRWGGQVEDTFSPASILIRPRSGNRKAAEFCSRVPVLARTGEGLEGRVVSLGKAAADDLFVRLEKAFGCAGLERITVLRIAGESETRSMPGLPGKCDHSQEHRSGIAPCRLVDVTLETFGDCYVRPDA